MCYIRSIVLCFITIATVTTQAQNLFTSKRGSDYTYVYQTTTEEAYRIHKVEHTGNEGMLIIDDSYFHTLVDSFQTHTEYKGSLPPGHYIHTHVQENLQHMRLVTVDNTKVFILNDGPHLILQIYDLSGNIVHDAIVNIAGQKLRFQPKSKTYIRKNFNKEGLVSINYKGFTAYYDLKKSHSNPAIIRNINKVLYHNPIKYVSIPIRFVLGLPYDGIKSIVKQKPSGSIYTITNWARRISSMHNRHKKVSLSYGYVVYNKPIYKPGDTLKCKAVLTSRNGKSFNKPVQVVLKTASKEINLGKIQPYRKGCYAYEFFLHDSLKLKLDNSYELDLRYKGVSLANGYFEYKEYELRKGNLILKQEETSHYKNKDYNVTIIGVDENNFNLIDARLEVTMISGAINNIYQKQFFLPDTLLRLKQKLDSFKATQIRISDSLFPNIDFSYIVKIKLITSDNEVHTEEVEVNYHCKPRELALKLIQDSLSINYLEHGKVGSVNFSLEASDILGNVHHINKGTTPYRLRINPLYISYTVTSDSLTTTLVMRTEPDLLSCNAERTPDSVNITLDNPRGIPINYYIYDSKKELASGYTDALNFKKRTTNKKNYFISLRYMWAGQIVEENYRIPLLDKKLQVDLIHPEKVYPGQKVRIQVAVTDYKGRAVKGVDLTAYGLTKKFNYTAPSLSYLGKDRGYKHFYSNFYINPVHAGYELKNLNYAIWKPLASLDTMAYYQFLYPHTSMYRYEYTTEDSITQFAPFVVSEGKINPIDIIYVDMKPVYFSWSTHHNPYAIAIDSGYHYIELVAHKKYISIDSVHFSFGKKLIFSIGDSLIWKNLKIKNLSDSSYRYLQESTIPYMLPYKNDFGTKLAYIQKGKDILLLNRRYTSHNYDFAGPVSGHLSFSMIDSDRDLTFLHEPNFSYHFQYRMLKMQKMQASSYNYSHSSSQDFEDQVMTKKALLKLWKAGSTPQTHRFVDHFYYRSYSNGTCRLRLNLKNLPVPTYILVFKHLEDEFLRIYPNQTHLQLNDLQPGKYKFVLFYPDSSYHNIDSVQVAPDGINYYEAEPRLALKKDSFGIKVHRILDDTCSKAIMRLHKERIERRIKNFHLNSYDHKTKATRLVQGFLKYEIDRSPVVGAIIYVKGTAIAAETNEYGYYTIKVPFVYDSLYFMTAYEPIYVRYIGSNKRIDVDIKEDHNLLESVQIFQYDYLEDRSTPVKAVEHGELMNPEGKILSAKQPSMSILPIGSNSPRDTSVMHNEPEVSGIRHAFSDYAFWQPKLITNKQGKVEFEVTYPDDITAWTLHCLAYKGKRHTGQTNTLVKAYKAISAQLSMPRFLLDGDTSTAIGKVSNHQTDSCAVTTEFKVNDVPISTKAHTLTQGLLDELPVVANHDTLNLNYSVHKADGFFDGERRTIPVFPVGMEQMRGGFHMLEQTPLPLSFDSTMGVVSLYAKADVLEILENEVRHVGDYKYLCNEQKASKIKALLAQQVISKYRNEPFQKDSSVKQLISRLLESRMSNGLWSWWNGAKYSYWTSIHVLEALCAAKAAGYEVALETEEVIRFLVTQFELVEFEEKAKILQIALLLHARTATQIMAAQMGLDTLKKRNLHDKLQIIRLKQQLGLKYQLDVIQKNLDTTFWGNIYIGAGKNSYSILDNDIQNTLLAYKILKADSTHSTEMLSKIRNYFFERRNAGYWDNTYQSAQIIETILPELLGKPYQSTTPQLLITGDVQQTVTQFPFELKLSALSKIKVSNVSPTPIYIGYHQKYWHTQALSDKRYFEVSTNLDTGTVVLKTGQELSLKVTIKVKYNADHVSVNVPIPAGCSYASKDNCYGGDCHREYYKNETTVFFEHLNEGTHTFEIKLLPRHKGVYTLNPVKVERLYFPVISSSNTIRKVRIE